MRFKATLQLGLASIPVGLEKATEATVSNKTVCVGSNGKGAHDPKPISSIYKCADCGEVVDRKELKKGVPHNGGFVVVEAEELAEAVADTDAQYKGQVALVPHPREGVEALTAQGSGLYIVHPGEGASQARYNLIAHAIASHPDLAFTCLYTSRTRALQYVARVKDGVIFLEERVRAANLRAVPVFDDQSYSEKDAKMMAMLVSTMVEDYEPDTYADSYAAAVEVLKASREVVALEGVTKGAAPIKVDSDDDFSAALAAFAAAQKPKGKKAKA